MTCGRTGRRLGLCILVLALGVSEGNGMEKNYWKVEGETLAFASAELAMKAELPLGWQSLTLGGHEFLQGGEGYGAMVYRKPDGSFVTAWTGVGNTSHDRMQGRNGAVQDGIYLIKVSTGWTLPTFEIYAGFNDKDDHDLVLFLHEDVLATRLLHKGAAASTARQIYTHESKPGGAKGQAAVLVHKSGVALRIHHALWTGVIKAPDGRNRLSVVIPCKGMAANNIECLIDTHNRSDNLLVWPTFAVDSPTMGQGDLNYKPQAHGRWALYEKGAELDYTFRFGWLGAEPFQGKAVVEARHALGQPHLRIEAAPTETEPGQYEAVLHPEFTLPGVSEVNVHLLDGEGVVLFTERLRVMVDWQNVQPTYRTPPDMKAFWDSTLETLSTIPLEPRVEEQLFKDDPTWEFYHVSFNGWEKKRIHACLYVPKEAKKPLPVLIGAHPGTRGFGVNHAPDGVFGSKIKKDPRFVSIHPLIRGHRPDEKDIPFNQPWWGPLDSRDEYVARSWFTAMVRALDYMATRPDLADMKRIVAKGGSQGGALALVTAALDPRVTVCLADCPSNCMHHDAVRPETYPTFGPTSGQVPEGQTLEDMITTLSYYDPAHMAPWIRCPTVVGQNVGDLTVHSMGALGVYKNLTGLAEDKKWFLPGVKGHFHAGSRAASKKYGELMDKVVAGELVTP